MRIIFFKGALAIIYFLTFTCLTEKATNFLEPSIAFSFDGMKQEEYIYVKVNPQDTVLIELKFLLMDRVIIENVVTNQNLIDRGLKIRYKPDSRPILLFYYPPIIQKEVLEFRLTRKLNQYAINRIWIIVVDINSY